MQKSKLRFLWVLLGLMLPTAWCMADASISIDGHVSHTLPMGANKAQLKLANTYGVAVATYDLMDSEGQKVLDLRGLSSGVYTYTVYCGNFSQSGKLVIVK
ncbi:MAG: T9SS type A sorting domain-containing protein [Prevotella sp.]|nr:T9SS type A sorting domain-containing protein [Prevotella sp.]